MRRAQRLDRGDAGHDLDIRQRIEPPRDAQRGIVQRGIAPDQQRDLAVTAEMIGDRLRPGRGDRVVPIVHALAVIGLACVTHGKIELGNARGVVGEHIRADRPPEIGKIGFCRPLARDQNEIGGVDRADRSARELPGIAATDADQGERHHDDPPSASAPNMITAAVEAAPPRASCSASSAMVVRTSRSSVAAEGFGEQRRSAR